MAYTDLILKAMAGKSPTIQNFIETFRSVDMPDGTNADGDDILEWLTDAHLPDFMIERQVAPYTSGIKIFMDGYQLAQRANGAPIYRLNYDDFEYIFIETKANFDKVVQSCRCWFDADPVFEEDEDLGDE